MLAILTNVDRVQKDFGKATAREIEKMSVSEARAMLSEGQFGAGSMRPKVEAAIQFLENAKTGREVLITSCERFAEGFRGETGTRVVR
jgi:carbamate kinase